MQNKIIFMENISYFYPVIEKFIVILWMLLDFFFTAKFAKQCVSGKD